MKWLLVLVLFVVLYVDNFIYADIEPERKTKLYSLGDLGTVKALIENSTVTNKEYYSFRDIRYAEAPNRDGKFKPSHFSKRITPEFFDATEYRQSCPNTYSEIPEAVAETEVLDCLRLSVHTPNIQGNFSVIVYLTGFDLLQGSNAEANPGYFMEHDIVFVSVQYRLGVFGFLNSNHPSIPGNAGITDMLTALRWIQTYVSLFGGNPESVTLMGQHKVAGIIQLLTMMPQADGLYHRIICQSGSIFTENLLSLSTSALSIEIGILLGCQTILDSKCILNASLSDLNNLFKKSLTARNGNVGLVTIDGYDRFIPYMPYELKERMKVRSYPMIMGIVENPSTYLMDINFPDKISIFSANRTNLIDGLGLEKDEYEEFLLERIENEDTKMRKNLMTAINFSDLSEHFVYLFRYRSGKHYLRRKPGNLLDDVTLLDDHYFLFPNPRFDLDETDRAVSKQLVELWTNFARNGTPNYQQTGIWPTFESERRNILIISKNLKIGKDFQNYRSPLFQ